MTTATATRTHRTPGLTAEQRRARQDELLATLADGVQSLTTSDGWRRYLRAMTTLRTYSSGNSGISQTRECTWLLKTRTRTRSKEQRLDRSGSQSCHGRHHSGHWWSGRRRYVRARYLRTIFTLPSPVSSSSGELKTQVAVFMDRAEEIRSHPLAGRLGRLEFALKFDPETHRLLGEPRSWTTSIDPRGCTSPC